MSSSFWLLQVASCDFSQAEKERTVNRVLDNTWGTVYYWEIIYMITMISTEDISDAKIIWVMVILANQEAWQGSNSLQVACTLHSMFLFACSTNTKMAEYSALNSSNCTTFLLLSSWSERGHESDSGDHFHITSVNPQRAQIVLLSFYSTLSYLSESGPQFKDCSKKLINNVLDNVKKK